MPDVRTALVVAGGAGTRLRPLTATTPKPLLPFCARPFLAGVLARLAGVGVDRVQLVVGPDPDPYEVLRPHAAALGIDLTTVPEPEPLDTAGGVRAVLDDLDDTVLVLNGDILTDVDLAAAVDAHRRAGAVATLVLTRVEDTASFGVCVREGTRVVDFVEKPEPGTLPGQDTVNAGTYVLEPEALAGFPTGPLSFERDVFPGLVAAGRHVEGFVSDAVWADLGTPQRWLAGHRLALDGALRWPPLEAVPADASGVRLERDAEVSATARLRGPLLIAGGARIGDGATIGPHATIGAGVRVARGAIVRDSVLDVEAHVGEHVTLDGALLGVGAEVGDDAEVGPDLVLGDHARIEAGERLAARTRRP